MNGFYVEKWLRPFNSQSLFHKSSKGITCQLDKLAIMNSKLENVREKIFLRLYHITQF